MAAQSGLGHAERGMWPKGHPPARYEASAFVNKREVPTMCQAPY